MASRTFRSVEFTDHEGDQVVGHEFLTDEEAQALMRRIMEAGGRDVAIHDLSPPQTKPAAVTSGHVIHALPERS